MKIVETFTDLDKANTYVTGINQEYKNQEAKINESAGQITALGIQLKDLQKQAEAATAQVTTLSAQLEASKSETAEALAEITELGQKLALQENHADKGLVVSIGRKSYNLIGDTFIYNGGSKTAKELSQDQEQLKKMLEKQSGSLVEIV